jgi:hypothetical protein
MEGISQEALDLLMQGAPQFVKCVDEAIIKGQIRRGPAQVSVTLEAFHDDPLLLYASLWYAGTKGVNVHVEPFGKA